MSLKHYQFSIVPLVQCTRSFSVICSNCALWTNVVSILLKTFSFYFSGHFMVKVETQMEDFFVPCSCHIKLALASSSACSFLQIALCLSGKVLSRLTLLMFECFMKKKSIGKFLIKCVGEIVFWHCWTFKLNWFEKIIYSKIINYRLLNGIKMKPIPLG